MERYPRVQRKKEVAFIRESLEAAGASVLEAPDPAVAPFCFKIMTPAGEVLELIIYVFLANKYRQKGRPEDEHRFQIKYGSEFDRYHEIYIPREDGRVTLMLGAHLEEEIFVAVDPAMHNPTWFSLSVEFKDENVAATHASGWSGWERPRVEGRRKLEKPLDNYQTEVVLGFTPENFLRYVQFERLAAGFDPGERLLLVDRLHQTRLGKTTTTVHSLEAELGLSSREILDMIDGAGRLKMAVRGWAAEHHLRDHLEAVSGMDEVETIEKDGQPDFRVVYRGGPSVRIECKNVLRRKVYDRPKVDFQRTRASKGNPFSRYYHPDEFEILAACLHPVTERWEFQFTGTYCLPPHKKCEERISNNVLVDGVGWTGRVDALLERVG